MVSMAALFVTPCEVEEEDCFGEIKIINWSGEQLLVSLASDETTRFESEDNGWYAEINDDANRYVTFAWPSGASTNVTATWHFSNGDPYLLYPIIIATE